VEGAQKEIQRVELDGAMLGRAAYHTPSILRDADRLFFADQAPAPQWDAVIDAMMEHAARHIAAGGRLQHATRHMVGLFHGLPGARRWRQMLSTLAPLPGAGPKVISDAFAQVRLDAGSQAA
jgi:tRNA-dihydrouridine synthase A